MRESEEEAGVKIDIGSVRYHSSQPWPFPQSLMLVFMASVPLSERDAAWQSSGWDPKQVCASFRPR